MKIEPMASGQASGLPCDFVASPCPVTLVRSADGGRSTAASLQSVRRSGEALALVEVAAQRIGKAANDEIYANAR